MPPKVESTTPLMAQHQSIKKKFPDAILLFRVGDFYETFGADAIITSKVLGITLTKRNNNDKASSELAGFPHHALDVYLHKLVKAGYRVAICDQLEDPKTAKGIVKRGVTEVVTPGIATDEKMLDQSVNNFLCALCCIENVYGIAFVDITTGEFFVTEGNEEFVDKLLQSFKPSEVLFSKNFNQIFKQKFGTNFFTYSLEDWIFTFDYAYDKLMQHFQVASLKGFGVEELKMGCIAAGVIIHYLKETEHHQLQQLSSLKRLDKEEGLWMDKFTIRNLELLNHHQDQSLSLIKTIDNTTSPMGARLLRRWLVFPLCHIDSINERLNAVDFFLSHTEAQNFFKKHVSEIGDIERFIAKIPLKKINPRELRHIAKALELCDKIQQYLKNIQDPLLNKLCEVLNPCQSISQKILNTIVENAPLNFLKGTLIKDNINVELDELKHLLLTAKEQLNHLLQNEIEQTKISSLKIGCNTVFGYYLEVMNTHKSKVPEIWQRRQTLTNAERYITPELKMFEEKILGAEEKIAFIEQNIYNNLLVELQSYIPAIQNNAQSIANIDCLLSFAFNAFQYKYCKPKLSENDNIEIVEGRHPVIERNMKSNETYIANSIKIDVEENQIVILTGPNMSGKSAILRQVALTVLLAHIGSFVPCKEAIIPLTDKIFTRVGANDNISEGESTFMVEMNETASILNNLSKKSLVLLDEIGRGTSTYDGISISWSIVEYLHQNPKHQAKTLFATHYHELNEMEIFFSRIKNFHVSYTETNQKVIFLRKLVRGGIKHSFGIQVAQMAGFPVSIIYRAKEILKELEEKNNHKTEIKNLTSVQNPTTLNQHKELLQLKKMQDFFSHTNIDQLTPIEALLKLHALQKEINSYN